MNQARMLLIRWKPALVCTCHGILLLLLTGCGGKPASVSGVISLDGKPLERGTVGFAPTGGGMRAAGKIQPDGSYELMTNRDAGLEVGEYAITISSREPGKEDPNGGPPMPGPYITPRRYAIAKTSGLKFEVTAGSHEYDIDLSSEGLGQDNRPRRRRR